MRRSIKPLGNPKQFHCERCGHKWNPRKPGVPLRCGGCKSCYWNRKDVAVSEEFTVEPNPKGGTLSL